VNVAAAFPAEVATLALTRRFVGSVLETEDVTPEQLDAAVLVTHELASNAMCHAGTDDVLVRLSRADNDLRIEVSDDGPCTTEGEPPQHGLGRSIIGAHCRAWGVEGTPTGKRIWALVPLSWRRATGSEADGPGLVGVAAPIREEAQQPM
jgi:signal transduction histidine kinase